jgi:hypothetical protein
MGNSISVIMTNAIFNMPTVPSYSESSSKAKYSSWEDKRVPVASARTMMTPGGVGGRGGAPPGLNLGTRCKLHALAAFLRKGPRYPSGSKQRNTQPIWKLWRIKICTRFQNLDLASSSTHTSHCTQWAIPDPHSLSTTLNSPWNSVVFRNNKTEYWTQFQCQLSSSWQETKYLGKMGRSVPNTVAWTAQLV